MPLVEVTIAEGRTPTQIRSLMRELHHAVQRTTDTRPEHVRVIVREVPRDHWATGDVTLTEMDAARGRTAAPTGEAATSHARRRAEERSDENLEQL